MPNPAMSSESKLCPAVSKCASVQIAHRRKGVFAENVGGVQGGGEPLGAVRVDDLWEAFDALRTRLAASEAECARLRAGLTAVSRCLEEKELTALAGTLLLFRDGQIGSLVFNREPADSRRERSVSEHPSRAVENDSKLDVCDGCGRAVDLEDHRLYRAYTISVFGIVLCFDCAEKDREKRALPSLPPAAEDANAGEEK